MYTYRHLTPEEKERVLHHRRLAGLPLHEPPHFTRENPTYLFTVATYEHRPILIEDARRIAYERELIETISGIPESRLFAWVIMPTHLHLLARTNIVEFSSRLGRLHNGLSTRWNREDCTVGRTVWYRFSDRGIRSERHFWATVNYIHFNPVKHGYARTVDAWRCSSVHLYLAEYGPDKLNALLQAYPIFDFGKGWDTYY